MSTNNMVASEKEMFQGDAKDFQGLESVGETGSNTGGDVASASAHIYPGWKDSSIRTINEIGKSELSTQLIAFAVK